MVRCRRWLLGSLCFLFVAGCSSGRDRPPAPATGEAPQEAAPPPPPCGKVLKGPGTRPGACCVGASAGILTSADIIATCGAGGAAAYLGEAPDGAACRFQFQASGADAKETFVMLTHPVIPVGSPAPVRPDPMLPWKWKKIPLRDAIAYQAVTAMGEPGLLERQTIFWAGRGRRILGLHVGKRVCNEEQARALLQKAIDGVP